MKKLVVSIVLGAGLLVGATPAAAAEGGHFYVGEWMPSKTKPSVVRAGVQIKSGVVDRWFVTKREECTIGDGKPEIAKQSSYSLNEHDLAIEDGHFRYELRHHWGPHVAVRYVFRGKVKEDSVVGLYRSRIRNHAPGRDREKCRTGPLRFELERGTSRAFFQGFDPFDN
jgi:hypothetical protein